MKKTSITDKKIGIIGGGIAGLTMALTLKRNNIRYKLFERADKFKEVGAGIGLSSNALKIFDRLNIGKTLRAKGHLITKTVLATEKLKILKEIPFPEEVYCIHRASIIDTISKELDKNSYTLNKELTEITNNKNVKIGFKDNTKAEFNTLIACDGIHSTIRNIIFPNITIRKTQHIIWRGITDFAITPDLKHTYYELFEGKLRFLFLPISNSKIFWLAVQEKKNFKKKTTTTTKTYLLDCFQNFTPKVLLMLQKTREKDILQNEISDIKPNHKKWFQNNVVFIGDAIHATTPNLAQGACQAIEDAYTLGLCLKNKVQNPFDVYQNLRIKKVNYIVKQSWMIGKLSFAKNYIEKSILYIILKYLPQKKYQNRFKRLLDIDYLNTLDYNL